MYVLIDQCLLFTICFILQISSDVMFFGPADFACLIFRLPRN